MNWYIARIIFSITTGNGRHTPQFDVQLRLIAASNQSDALLRARDIGMKEDEIFLSETGEMIRWHFIDVADLKLIPAFENGLEIYSQIEEKEDAKSFVKFIKSKAGILEQQHDITFAAN